MKTMQKPFRQNKQRGFTLVEIMIVVGIVSIVVMIAITGWVKARDRSARTACQENLTKIDHAKEMLAFEENKGSGTPVNEADIVGPDKFLRHLPECPMSGVYSFNPISTYPACSLAETEQHWIVVGPVADGQ